MKRFGLLLCPVLFCVVFPLQTGAQTQTGAQIPAGDIARFSEKYMLSASDHAALFIGRIQGPLIKNMESMYLRDRGIVERDSDGFEIFPSPVSPIDSYAVGDVLYDGTLYIGVRMRLDLYRDEFMVSPPNGVFFSAVLDPGLFGYADLRGYRILHFPAPVSRDDIPEGYYQQLYDGRHSVLKKEVFHPDPVRYEFTRRTIRYYVEKDGIHHPVGRQKGPLLRLFRDKRGELNRFIRSEGLDLRHDTERALPAIVSEYERITDR